MFDFLNKTVPHLLFSVAILKIRSQTDILLTLLPYPTSELEQMC